MYALLEEYKKKYGLKQRNVMLMSPPRLRYSDTGELLVLLSMLGHMDCTKLHIKINNYFKQSLGAVSIIIENTHHECYVRAIGNVALQKTLVLQSKSKFFSRNLEGGIHWVQRNEIEGELCCHLEAILNKEYHTKLHNCLMLPFYGRKGYKLTHHVLLLNVKPFFRCEEFYSGVVHECLRLCSGIIVSVSLYGEQLENHNDCKAMVTAFVEMVSNIGTDMIYQEIKNQSLSILDASNCLLYLMDAYSELYLQSSTITQDITINEDPHKLLTSYMIETGKPFYCDKLSEEPLYEYCGTGIIPRNVLSLPVRDEGQELGGVLELYQLEEPQTVHKASLEERARALGRVVCRVLSVHDSVRALVASKAALDLTDCFFLRRMKITPNDLMMKHITTCDVPLDYHRFSDVRFDPTLIPEDHVLCACYKVFDNLGLLKMFNLNGKKFARFLMYLKNAYNTLPFHNWDQAFATFHFSFVLINYLRLVKNKYITLLETLALLLAGLCHCVDSRGSTTPFALFSGTVQGSLFSSPGSLAQKYYASQALKLMAYPECNFLENLSDEMFTSFAVIFIDIIKDTDLSNHTKKVQALERLDCSEYDFYNWNHRMLFHNILINLSQINFIIKPWSYCRAVGDACYNEFYRKGDLTFASDVYETTELNEDILKLPEICLQFMQKIGLPSFKAMINIFPLLEICLQKIEANTENWKEEKEKILASMAKDALGGGEGEGDEIALINPFVKG